MARRGLSYGVPTRVGHVNLSDGLRRPTGLLQSLSALQHHVSKHLPCTSTTCTGTYADAWDAEVSCCARYLFFHSKSYGEGSTGATYSASHLASYSRGLMWDSSRLSLLLPYGHLQTCRAVFLILFVSFAAFGHGDECKCSWSGNCTLYHRTGGIRRSDLGREYHFTKGRRPFPGNGCNMATRQWRGMNLGSIF